MTTIPISYYRIDVYDHDQEYYTQLQHWGRLEFHQRVNGSWNYQLTFELSKTSDYLNILRSINPDFYVLISRIDPTTLEEDLVYEGLQQTRVDQLRKNGDVIINLYGVGYTSLLKRRVVLPPVDNDYSEKSGYAEDVVKGYVGDCLSAPTDLDRKMPGFLVGASGGSGGITSQKIRYTNLLTVVENITGDGDLDYGVVGTNPPSTFTFIIRNLWGTDRTKDNIEGNAAVIFSPDLGNMEIPIVSQNYSDEKNYVYVTGRGTSIEEERYELANPDTLFLSPLSRKEAYTSTTTETDTDALKTEAISYLEDNKPKEDITFNTRQTDNTRWLREWNLGDLVTAKYFNLTFTKQIVEVSVVVTRSEDENSLNEIVNAELQNV